MMKIILLLPALAIVGLVHTALAQSDDWHLSVFVYDIPQNTGNLVVDVYGPGSNNPLVSQTVNGDQTGGAYAQFNIAGSDIGPGDNYKICVTGQSGSPACFDKTHQSQTDIAENIDWNPP